MVSGQVSRNVFSSVYSIGLIFAAMPWCSLVRANSLTLAWGTKSKGMELALA